MICPGTRYDCDNPGCRHGGCQGRLPQLPLFQSAAIVQPAALQAHRPIAASLNEEVEPVVA